MLLVLKHTKFLYFKFLIKRKEDFKSNLVSLNQEKTKLEETLVAMKKKYQQEIQTNKTDVDAFKQLEKKDKAILELKAKLNLKEQ